jgi:hypothetical protein
VDRTAPHHAVRLCIGAPPSAERLRQGLTIIDRLIDEEIDERYQAMA